MTEEKKFYNIYTKFCGISPLHDSSLSVVINLIIRGRKNLFVILIYIVIHFAKCCSILFGLANR